MSGACDHVWFEHPDGGVWCPECDARREERPPCWAPGEGFPAVRGDIRPHFNLSVGRPIRSRRELQEVCAREGLRPVDPTLNTEDAVRTESARLKKNNRHRIKNPKTSLLKVYEEEQCRG